MGIVVGQAEQRRIFHIVMKTRMLSVIGNALIWAMVLALMIRNHFRKP